MRGQVVVIFEACWTQGRDVDNHEIDSQEIDRMRSIDVRSIGRHVDNTIQGLYVDRPYTSYTHVCEKCL